MSAKHLFLYAVYGVAAALFFLITLFPGERAAYLLCKEINTSLVNGEVSIEKVEPLFPPGLKAINPTILFDDGKRIQIASIALYPEILSLYKDLKQIRVSGQAYGGTIDGTVGFGILPPSQPASSGAEGTTASLSEAKSSESSGSRVTQPCDIAVAMKFVDMDIRDLSHSVEGVDTLSSFKMSASFNYRGYIEEFKSPEYDSINSGKKNNSSKSVRRDSGGGNLSLSQCTVRSDNVLLKQIGAGEVKFEAVDMEWSKSGDRVKVASLNADGPYMKIGLKGDLILKLPVEKSTLNLRGEFRPDPSHLSSFAGLASLATLFAGSSEKGISFRITGTFQEPRVVTP